MWTQPGSDVCQPSPVSAVQPMMFMVPNFAVPSLPQAVSPMSPGTPADFQSCNLRPTYSRSDSHSDDVVAAVSFSPSSQVKLQRSSKGPISQLQEFVQSSKAHPLPSSCAVLQWSHENRMAGSSLQFRATTSFILDGVPHHVLGGWWASKKQSQRDAAERALTFFVGMCGQEIMKSADKMPSDGLVGGEASTSSPADLSNLERDVMTLQRFLGDSVEVSWNCRWEAQKDLPHLDMEALCRSSVEFNYLGVPHVFAGKLCRSKAAARADTARRVLWYLHCPGYECLFEADQERVKTLAQVIPEPVAGMWPPGQVFQEAGYVMLGAASPVSTVASSSAHDFDSSSPASSPSASPGQRKHGAQPEVLERKTTVMRLQNRLQKIFAKQLTPGKSVWSWRYDKNDQDGSFQASVHIDLLDKTFSGGWAPTHQAAQMEACQKLWAFLDEDITRQHGGLDA
eukprot:TRINITY_DN1994_c0_g1_i2.p1 TRINITY_DN1994_c0_g1~~TRINITY_DN1994_c0_g1_i2.p1  ORF type:complete len:454 (+),score=95.26 TRINITY_DN1994_c0_g1_i2:87-1448(+)